MKEILLTQNKVALVDDDDYLILIKHNWLAHRNGNTFYAERYTKKGGVREAISMHRIIMNVPDEYIIDHKDGNGLNNQKINLRICSNAQNQQNKKGWAKSGFKGVYRNVYKMKSIRYRSMIQVDGRTLHLGYFDTPIEAALAYDKAAKQYFGEFANFNFK